MCAKEVTDTCLTVAIPSQFYVKRTVECVGPAFLRYCTLKQHGRDGLVQQTTEDEKVKETVFEDDMEYLRSLDPKEWKEQDHYAVLGMRTLRYKATDDDIKRAYRQKVLKHHPDKRKGQGEEIRSEDDYFTCITKAYEILGTPSKRRSYDSVDPEFDDNVPSLTELKKDGFFKTLSKYFESNARWSDRRNVPKLGDDNTTREQVEKFYSFWYDFDSWREFSYQDEEEKEKGQDREERRWIEKQNKAARAKKKKEEMTRLRSLVDLAYNNDPRIAKFKQEEKDKKLAFKRARQDAVQAKKAEEERVIKEAQLAKQKAEEAERARIEAVRAEREQQKKHLRRERKALRDMCKANNFYANSADDSETSAHQVAVDRICEMFKLVELQDFMKDLESNGRQSFVKVKKQTEEKLEAERRALFGTPKIDEAKPVAKKQVTLKGPIEWSSETIKLLIKAVNLFPAGTNQRWDVVANFLNQHGKFTDERRFVAKDVLGKAKDLQNADFSKSSMKQAANQEAFDHFEKENKKIGNNVDDSHISKNDDKPDVKVASKRVEKPVEKPVSKPDEKPIMNGDHKEKPKMNGDIKDIKPEPKKEEEVEEIQKKEGLKEIKKKEEVKETKKKEEVKEIKEEVSWTKQEQALLEQAIKTYPASTPERWDRISECIPNRSKKDCMKRFKELVDLVKSKKQAANLVK